MKISELIIDIDSYDESVLADLLHPFVRIGSNGAVRLLPTTLTLDTKKKILLFLLAQEAIRHESIDPINKEISPTILCTELKIIGGTLRPILKILKDSNLVLTEDGYKINILALNEIKDLFIKGGEK